MHPKLTIELLKRRAVVYILTLPLENVPHIAL
jgi:hypothetical protein